jgi:hypothetical protein
MNREVLKATDWLRLVDVPAYIYHVTGDDLLCTGTIRRWMTRGKSGYDGRLIRLRYNLRGRTHMMMTRKMWVDEFLARIRPRQVEGMKMDMTRLRG